MIAGTIDTGAPPDEYAERSEPVKAEARKQREPIRVELRQLVGLCVKNGRKVKKAHPLDQILVNGKEVAQVGHTPGVPVSVLRLATITKREMEAISAAITQKRGTPPAKFNFPPNIELSQSIDEDDDGGSDEFTYE